MLQDTEIVKLLKTAYDSKLPQWRLDYMARICKNLQVHTKGLLFSKVDTLFPHEHPDSKMHCINTYEAITKGSVWKAINNITRIFSNSSFTVSASDSTLAFINDNNFSGGNLFSFFLNNWTASAIATDPNGLCAIYPPEYINDTHGDKIRFIKNEHIKMLADDMIVFISEDESEKTYSVEDSVLKREVFYDPSISKLNACSVVEKTYNSQVVCKIVSAVYHVFTKEYFIRFTQTSDQFTYDIYYFKKPFEIIPAFALTAVPLVEQINESFVASFIPFGNLALLQHRNHRAVDLMFSYPRMSEIQTPCDNNNCHNGLCPNPNPDDAVTIPNLTCSRCHGSGWLTIQSPYKTYIKKIDTGLSDPEAIKQLLASSPVDFHTPDTGILNYSKDSWKEYLAMAEEAVFVQQKQMTGNVESGVAKQIDKEGEYSWIQNISKALNNDLSRAIQCIENYNNASPATVSLEQPISFAVVTETEAFEALDIIISGETPVFIKSQQVESFITKFVSRSSPIVKALNILKLVDPLWAYSNNDIQTFKSNNVVSTQAWTIHIYAYAILMQLYEKDKLLFDNTDDAIVKMVMDAIDAMKPDDTATSLKAKLMAGAGGVKLDSTGIIVKNDTGLEDDLS